MARITCCDGVGCIGGNKILLEDGGTKLWLDFGLDFGRMGDYYEEFLKPKTSAGLYEHVDLGLLPPMRDLYRPELTSSKINPWDGIAYTDIGDVHGILLSHAHLDHIGQLHFVRDDIPIYSSAMTLAIAKCGQDTGGSDQYCYTYNFEELENGEIKSIHHSKNPSKPRPYVLVDEPCTEELSEFWNTTPGSLSERGRKHESCAIATSSKCGGLNIRRYPVDHSVYGASAWAIETEAGWVVYSGDIRCHGGGCNATWEFADKVAELKPKALIIEGTRIDNDDTSTEDQVRDNALDAVKGAKGLVVADFGPRNIERLISFLQIAKETGRKLCLLQKDAYLLEKMRLVDENVPSLDDPSILIYCKFETTSANWKKLIREEHQSRFRYSWDIAKEQDKMICCFSFFDANELPYIRPVEGSIWIYSSCEPFSEEMQFDYKRLGNWLTRYGMSFPSGYDDEKSPFHVSGHACRPHLREVVERIRPDILIPVHCEKPEKYVEMVGGICEVRLPERGVAIVI